MNKKYTLPVLLIFQILFLKTVACFPSVIEQFYSNKLYFFISKILRITFGKILFSVGDFIYLFLLVFLLKWIYKNRKILKNELKSITIQILKFLSIFYFVFHFFWGLNYYREPLSNKLEIKNEYSKKELLNFTQKIITKTNTIHKQISKNETLKIYFPYTHQQVFNLSLNGFKKITQQHPDLKYSYLSIKKSIFSLPLSYMGFSGYLNPFTNEAQVNYLIPMYNLPITSCHEMAHQMGFASESECNFIGFLSSIKNDDLYFQYSGYSFALRYCMNNWFIRDKDIYKKLLKTINKGILKNYQESQEFWKKYETPIEVLFYYFYDNFLKINQQDDGMNSYSKFINLMVNYFNKNDF